MTVPAPDGRRYYDIVPILFGKFRVVLTNGYTVDDMW